MTALWETSDFKFELKSLDDAGQLEGYAAVFGNEDKGGDVIEPGAFTKSIIERPIVPILWQHDPSEPIGVSTHAEEDRHGLLVKGQLNMDVQRAREARSLLQQKALGGLSIGYRTIQHSYQGSQRRLKELAVKEFSPVTFPMNNLAVASVKASGSFPIGDRDRPWDADGADTRIRAKVGATQKPNAEYAATHFFPTSTVPTDFDAYKLGFCDVVNGEITAIPRAIFACAAVMQGSRGGVQIPDGDRAAIEAEIAGYYHRMAKQFDDPSIRAPWDSGGKSLDWEEFSAFLTELKAGRVFSAANVQKLQAMRDQHRDMADQMDALLAMCEPPEPPTGTQDGSDWQEAAGKALEPAAATRRSFIDELKERKEARAA